MGARTGGIFADFKCFVDNRKKQFRNLGRKVHAIAGRIVIHIDAVMGAHPAPPSGGQVRKDTLHPGFGHQLDPIREAVPERGGLFRLWPQ